MAEQAYGYSAIHPPAATTQPGYPATADAYPMLRGERYFFKQELQLLECLTGCEMQNKYDLIDAATMQPVVRITERSECCERICCGPARAFTLHFTETATNREFARLERPFTCPGFHCCECGLRSGVLYGAGGRLLSTMHEAPCSEVGCCGFGLEVYDAAGKPIEQVRLEKENRCSALCCMLCRDIPFSVLDARSGKNKMTVVKKKPGSGKEVFREFTGANVYDLNVGTIPQRLSEDTLRMIACAAMVDYHLYEHAKNNN